mgnify:FL=1
MPPTVRESAPDEETLRRLFLLELQEGDSDAYDQCLQAIAQRLCVFFRKRLRKYSDDIDDLVQDVLLAIHLKRHTYREQEPFTVWVYAIARYKWIDFLRRNNRRKDISIPLDPDFWAQETPADDFHSACGADFDLNALFMELPKNQQAVITHTKIEGLTIVETASRTGMSISSVKVNIHRGLKTLAEKMGGKGK